MAVPFKKFFIGERRFRACRALGFSVGKDGCLRSVQSEGERWISLNCLDSGTEGTSWGRMTVRAEMGVDNVLVLAVLASEEPVSLDINPEKWESAIENAGGVWFVNKEDMLLYGQQGRYLWIGARALGAGEVSLKEITVYEKGDIFMDTFPEIYREPGSFFHRYLSIFSSLYTDFQQRIDSVPELLEPEKAPAWLLPEYLGWFGITVRRNMLEEDKMRRLLREAPFLNRFKGTKKTILRLAGLLADCPVTALEDGSFHFTLLLDREADKALRDRLRFLLDQFKPARVQYSLVFLKECGGLDEYVYLGQNARLLEPGPGTLDTGNALGALIQLK